MLFLSFSNGKTKPPLARKNSLPRSRETDSSLPSKYFCSVSRPELPAGVISAGWGATKEAPRRKPEQAILSAEAPKQEMFRSKDLRPPLLPPPQYNQVKHPAERIRPSTDYLCKAKKELQDSIEN